MLVSIVLIGLLAFKQVRENGSKLIVLRRVILSTVIMMVILTAFIMIVVDIYAIFGIIENLYSIALSPIYSLYISLFLSVILFINKRHSRPIDNWQTWSIVANSTLSKIYVVLYFLISFYFMYFVKPGYLETFPAIFFVIWLVGLCFFIFTLLYKLNAPKIFSFSSFENFQKEVKSMAFFRLERDELFNSIEKEIKSSNLYFSKYGEFRFADDKFLKNDYYALRNAFSKNKIDEETYLLLQQNSRFLNGKIRMFTNSFVIIPFYFLLFSFLLNVFSIFPVGIESLLATIHNSL